MTPRPLKTAVEILLSGEIQKSDSRRQKMAVFRRALSMIVLSPQANRPGASIMAMSKCEREILSD
jgi:ribosome maturation protein Sdo1